MPGFHPRLAPSTQREATTRKGWSWGKAIRTGIVKGKEGFGSLSGPFHISHAGVWAEPRAAWGLSQSEPGLAPSGRRVGIQTLLAGVLGTSWPRGDADFPSPGLAGTDTGMGPLAQLSAPTLSWTWADLQAGV